MYVLVHTPTSPGSSVETSTFSDIDALWEHVKQLKGHTGHPTQTSDQLDLTTENSRLTSILKNIYTTLDNEFRGIKQGQADAIYKWTLDPEIVYPKGDASGNNVNSEISIDIESTSKEHETEELLERFNIKQEKGELKYDASEVDTVQQFFINNFLQERHSFPDKQKKFETFFCWVLFVSSPSYFLKRKGVSFPSIVKILSEYDRTKVISSFSKLANKYVIKADDESFQTYTKLLKEAIPKDVEKLEFIKLRPWQQICCDTLIELYAIAEDKKEKFSLSLLNGWIQFFLDANVIQKNGSTIQSSSLYSNFLDYMTKIIKKTNEKTLFIPLMDAIFIQHFARTLKEVHGIKAQRKSAGVFYVDIDYAENGAGPMISDNIPGADFSDLHEESKIESTWAPVQSLLD